MGFFFILEFVRINIRLHMQCTQIFLLVDVANIKICYLDETAINSGLIKHRHPIISSTNHCQPIVVVQPLSTNHRNPTAVNESYHQSYRQRFMSPTNCRGTGESGGGGACQEEVRDGPLRPRSPPQPAGDQEKASGRREVSYCCIFSILNNAASANINLTTATTFTTATTCPKP